MILTAQNFLVFVSFLHGSCSFLFHQREPRVNVNTSAVDQLWSTGRSRLIKETHPLMLNLGPHKVGRALLMTGGCLVLSVEWSAILVPALLGKMKYL